MVLLISRVWRARFFSNQAVFVNHLYCKSKHSPLSYTMHDARSCAMIRDHLSFPHGRLEHYKTNLHASCRRCLENSQARDLACTLDSQVSKVYAARYGPRIQLARKLPEIPKIAEPIECYNTAEKIILPRRRCAGRQVNEDGLANSGFAKVAFAQVLGLAVHLRTTRVASVKRRSLSAAFANLHRCIA